MDRFLTRWLFNWEQAWNNTDAKNQIIQELGIWSDSVLHSFNITSCTTILTLLLWQKSAYNNQRRIMSGNVWRQDPKGLRTINMGDGNYNERIEGDYIETYIHNVTPTQQNPPNNLQFQGSANFVGRQHELNILRDRLQLSGIVAITAVAGMGGVGKTELATQYARLYEKDYPGGICWLSARDSDLAASIVQFAQIYMKLEVPQKDFSGRLFSLTEQVAWCWQHWQPSEGLVLIVLNDVTSLDGCRDFLPRANRFRVLMTTRVRNLDPNIEEISLDVLSTQEALELLTKLVGQKRVQKEPEVANQLCEWLSYLPLGLELVGR